MFFVLKKEKKLSCLCSKHNSNREKQFISLIIPNGEGWYYLAVKKLSALLKGITSKRKDTFYCLNCLHCSRTKNKGFCNIIMTCKDTKKH